MTVLGSGTPSPPVNNPVGGARSNTYVGVGYIGWESTFVQTEKGKGTFIVPAHVVPFSMGGQTLVLGEGGSTYDDPPGSYVYHYGDYISGPLIFWYDADGYWSEPPNAYGQYFVVDWGDGSPLERLDATPFGGSIYEDGPVAYPGTTKSHVYSSNGTRTVTLYVYTILPDGTPDWYNHIPTNYVDESLWFDVQSIIELEVVANDGPTYVGYTGPQDKCGLSVVELTDFGNDDTFFPRAFVMSIPWADMRTGTAIGDMPSTHLSKPIGEADNGSYWPGELFNAAADDGFDVGFNNDLATGPVTVLPTLDPYTDLVSISPPEGYRTPWGRAQEQEEHYWDSVELLFGLDGMGRMIVAGYDSILGTSYSDDLWNFFWYTALGATGRSAVKHYFPAEMQMFMSGQPIPRLRMLYSDTELLVEVGDGNLLVFNMSTNAWYFLTNLLQFKVGEPTYPGRGYGVQRRAGGGFWQKSWRSNSPTNSPHYPVHPIVIGIGKDGVIDYDIDAPDEIFTTGFTPGDFPDIGGQTWQVHSVLGDPDDHNVVYALSGPMEPYPEYRRTIANSWQGPQLDPNNTWIRYVRLVSVVFRCVNSDLAGSLVPNGNFETDVSGWAADDTVGGPSTFVRSTSWSSSGSASFEATGYGGNGSWFKSTAYIPVTPNADYDLAGQLKCIGGTTISGWHFGLAFYTDTAGTHVAGQWEWDTPGGSVGDGPIGGTITAPADAAYARVFFRAIGTASLYYVDAITLIQVSAPEATPVPCVWLQHPNWISTDGQFYPDRVRIPYIYLSCGWWTDSDYSGGVWQGRTKVTPTLAVTDTATPKNVVFNPRPTGV